MGVDLRGPTATGRTGPAERRGMPPGGVRAALRARLHVSGAGTVPFALVAASSVCLLVLGLVMIFSASFVQSTAESGDAFGIIGRQLLWAAVGLPPAAAAALADHRVWRRVAIPLLLLATVLSALVLVPGLGTSVAGARRWFDLGLASFQPSEMVKLVVPLAVARMVDQRWRRVRAGDMRALLLPALPLLALVTVLVLAGPDLETALLVAATGGAVLFVAGLPGRLLAGGLLGAGGVGLAGVLTSDYRRERVAAWLDPASDPANVGYQAWQGLLALGSGGVFGVGLGASRGKWLYIPGAHTDFVFAIIGEELGLVGALFVLALFVALAAGGVLTAQRAADPFGRLVATGITTWMVLQAGINTGSVVGLLPITGVTLPLVSYGGSSLVFTMLGIGILISIARQATDIGDEP